MAHSMQPPYQAAYPPILFPGEASTSVLSFRIDFDINIETSTSPTSRSKKRVQSSLISRYTLLYPRSPPDTNTTFPPFLSMHLGVRLLLEHFSPDSTRSTLYLLSTTTKSRTSNSLTNLKRPPIPASLPRQPSLNNILRDTSSSWINLQIGLRPCDRHTNTTHHRPKKSCGNDLSVISLPPPTNIFFHNAVI